MKSVKLETFDFYLQDKKLNKNVLLFFYICQPQTNKKGIRKTILGNLKCLQRLIKVLWIQLNNNKLNKNNKCKNENRELKGKFTEKTSISKNLGFRKVQIMISNESGMEGMDHIKGPKFDYQPSVVEFFKLKFEASPRGEGTDEEICGKTGYKPS